MAIHLLLHPLDTVIVGVGKYDKKRECMSDSDRRKKISISFKVELQCRVPPLPISPKVEKLHRGISFAWCGASNAKSLSTQLKLRTAWGWRCVRPNSTRRPHHAYQSDTVSWGIIPKTRSTTCNPPYFVKVNQNHLRLTIARHEVHFLPLKTYWDAI